MTGNQNEIVPELTPCWNALARSRAGLAAHVVESVDGEVRRVACSNDGDEWCVVEGEESESVRLCGSCRKKFAGPAHTLLDKPPALPVRGVEFTTLSTVATTADYLKGSA